MNISVIIPTLNEDAMVESSIRRAWECGANEVIVADGGSSDATCQIALNCQCRLVRSQPGRGTQMNSGAAVASGDVFPVSARGQLAGFARLRANP